MAITSVHIGQSPPAKIREKKKSHLDQGEKGKIGLFNKVDFTEYLETYKGKEALYSNNLLLLLGKRLKANFPC